MNFFEENILPLDQVQNIDIEYIFFTLVDLSSDPMPIEVTKQMVGILRGRSVTVPFSDIVREQCFVNVSLGSLV